MATAAETLSAELVSLSLLSLAGEPSILGLADTRGSATSTLLLSCSSAFSPTDGTTTAMLASMLGVPSDMLGFSHLPTGVADAMAIAAAVPEMQYKSHSNTTTSNLAL